MESGSEDQEHPLETYWMSLGIPFLEPKSQGISSLESIESDFFRLGPFGLHLEFSQCFSEEQSDCLSSTPYDIISWT